MSRVILTVALLTFVGMAYGEVSRSMAGSEWLSVPGESAVTNATSWFIFERANVSEVKSVRWLTAGLGVYDVYVNGCRVGSDFLKPGFTHPAKTKYFFSYDVTDLVRLGKGASNLFCAEVSTGWWSDRIVGNVGKKSAFRGVLEYTYADGSVRRFGTRASEWRACYGGPLVSASIYDGETYDARIPFPFTLDGSHGLAEANCEFFGEVLPTDGAEVVLRHDLALRPEKAFVWGGVVGADATNAYGTVCVRRMIDDEEPFSLDPGETLVLDFGQNAAAIPRFRFRANVGTVLTALPGEMLNDGNGLRSRGNDGPEGSVYRANLRGGNSGGTRISYTFGTNGWTDYHPRFSFFGYRYLSVTATDRVEIESVRSAPVTSVRKEQETGTLETGNASVNRLIANARWGQLSNYLSVPTDCPQRDERLGWTADTQVFAEAATFNADVRDFLRKWMRDMRDVQGPLGGFPGVAPPGAIGKETMRFGWGDAAIIVPYVVWKQYGDVRIVRENWAAMKRMIERVDQTHYRLDAVEEECRGFQYADWVSFEPYETSSGKCLLNIEKYAEGDRRKKPEAVRLWNYLGGCYWLMDAGMMRQMAHAVGESPEPYATMEDRARNYLRKEFFSSADGRIDRCLRGMQTPALFALKLGLVEGEAKKETIAELRRNFNDHGGCLQTGFLGTSILMDALTENGMVDVAYSLLFQRKNPSWLYSVDQGATTIWERWNSYTKEKGFGPVGMNSFNHYAYGAVLAWMYRYLAGIAPDSAAPGFRKIVMRPIFDRRLGYVKAEYRSVAGLIRSHWRYEGDKVVWEFEITSGSTALVRLPGEAVETDYGPGVHRIERVE